MEFAKKQLEKYGWSDGKGLGKDENGISEPIKAKIKHSLTGVGYDPASDFTEHWWSALYDKAAANLEVKNVNGKTKKIRRKSKEEFQITNSTWKMKKTKKSKPTENEYSEFFVKTAVLGEGGSQTTRVRDSETESDEEADSVSAVKLSDEELFKACQGRTAHKGARHGLRALGKLARIEQQEQILLKQERFEGYTHHEKLKNNCSIESQVVEDTNLNSDTELNTNKKKKKKKRCSERNSSAATDEVINAPSSSKTKDNIVELIPQGESLEGEEINTTKKKKKRKQCKKDSEMPTMEQKTSDSDVVNVNEILDAEEVMRSKKKKQKKK